MSEYAEEVIIYSRKCTKVGQILLTLMGVLAQVTARLVQPFELSALDGCTEVPSLHS